MQISKKCVDLVKKFEGLSMVAYQDAVGVWTIGYGTTGAVDGVPIRQGMQITQGKAEELLAKDLRKFANHVNKYDSIYKWTQNEFDALVSFAYNIGNIDQLTAKGARTRKQIAEHWLAYNKAGGKVLAGLVRRRQAELELFTTVDSMVERIDMIINGKRVSVDRILHEGTNYVKIRDVGNALGMTVGNDGNIPILTSK